MPELPIIPFETPDEWEKWLEKNHTESSGIWLKIAKKESGHPSVNYAEALDVALCFGWIDGQKDKFDDEYWLQKFTPRRAKSGWSAVNREKIDKLTAAGKMRPAGLREVENAKKDGRWDTAYLSQSKIGIPEDFQTELDKNPVAKEFFGTLKSAQRYSFLYRITTAKKAETRQKRITDYITLLNEKKTL